MRKKRLILVFVISNIHCNPIFIIALEFTISSRCGERSLQYLGTNLSKQLKFYDVRSIPVSDSAWAANFVCFLKATCETGSKARQNMFSVSDIDITLGSIAYLEINSCFILRC